MRRFLSAALVSGLCLVASGVGARGQDAGARARALAANFNKEKHKVKEVRGVRLDIFVEVRGEPAVKSNAAEYSGAYASEPDYALDLRVSADGTAEGHGTEPSPAGARRFTLRDAHLSGPVLTATKLYEDGSTDRLEAVFINLTTRHSPTDAGTTRFGLGAVFDPPKAGPDGFNLTRLFYAKR